MSSPYRTSPPRSPKNRSEQSSSMVQGLKESSPPNHNSKYEKVDDRETTKLNRKQGAMPGQRGPKPPVDRHPADKMNNYDTKGGYSESSGGEEWKMEIPTAPAKTHGKGGLRSAKQGKRKQDVDTGELYITTDTENISFSVEQERGSFKGPLPDLKPGPDMKHMRQVPSGRGARTLPHYQKSETSESGFNSDNWGVGDTATQQKHTVYI